MERNAYVATLIIVVVSLALFPATAQAFCYDEAATEYHVPPQALSCIADVESGQDPFSVHYNMDGSKDVGLMQINSSWYRKIKSQSGIEVADAFWRNLANPCYNVRFGAWVLSDCIHRYRYTWEAIGCYNAANPVKRAKYAKKVQTQCLPK